MLVAIEITTSYPLWFIPFCLLLGVIYAGIFYYKENKFEGIAVWLKRTMLTLRFLLISLLAFLLLSPFLKTIFNKVDKPIIIIAQDNSSSIILAHNATFNKTAYLENLANLRTTLSENYEVRSFTFGEKITEQPTIDFSEKTTNIAQLFEEINTKFYNRNIGALILASDGIYNEGSNPVFSANKTVFPVYSIALGDTTIHPDIILKEIKSNKITFLDNQFPIEISGFAQSCLGKKTTLTVAHKGKTVFSKEFSISTKQQLLNESIFIKATEVGVQRYTISFSVVNGEISTTNNAKDIYVEVLDGRQNILILANAPHPDIKALKNGIEFNENYNVTTSFFSDFDGNIAPFNLIIFHQIPATRPAWMNTIEKEQMATLYILGNQTLFNQFNAMNTGLNVQNTNNRFNSVFAHVPDNFPLFILSEETKKQIQYFPPLESAFGEYRLKENGYILFQQKIGAVVTNNPLLVFFQKDKQKTAILCGEGIWRWRMSDFSKNNNHNAFNELINKTVQFLAVKDNKNKFRIISKNSFNENEEIVFNAELYNDSYELINEPEITIELKNEDDKKYNFVFNKTAKSYFLNAGMLPVGSYEYVATVKLGDKTFTEKGQFQVNALLLEANNTVANHQLLQNLSEKLNGKMLYPNQLNQLAEMINKDNNIASIIYEETDLKELINLRWIFFILLGLLSLEWFLRKRNGAY